MTLTNSTVSGNNTTGDLAYRGGVSARGVTLTNSIVSGNSTTGRNAYGGGISGGTVTLTHSIVSGNSTTGWNALGGGIFGGTVTVTHSTVSGNSSTGAGGGMFAGNVTITDSSISDNSTTGDQFSPGGGVAAGGDVTLTGSTVSGNSTAGLSAGGGGVWSFGAITLTHSTVTDNHTKGASATGGGINNFNFLDNEPITITGSIVAGNTAGGGEPDIEPGIGTLTARYSLIGDNAGTGLAEAQTADASGNLIGSAAGAGVINPLLAPLADNGGPTETHALLPGSPAIDAGDPTSVAGVGGVPEFDQRGAPFARVVGAAIDIGAFEVSIGDLIQQYVDDGTLNRGQANSLLVKLELDGNPRANRHRAEAFVHQVDAFVRAGILTPDQGQALLVALPGDSGLDEVRDGALYSHDRTDVGHLGEVDVRDPAWDDALLAVVDEETWH